MKPSTMPVSESLSNILYGVEEMKKRALKGTEFEDESTQGPAEEPQAPNEPHAAPESKPAGPVKCEARTPRMCKKELLCSPGVPGAGVADLQVDAPVPPTLPTSPVAESARKSTPKSSRRKRGSSRSPKDKTPEAKPKTPEEKPSSRTPKEKTPEEKPSRTPQEKAPEEKLSRTPKEKAPEKRSRTPKEKAPEKPAETPKEKAPEGGRSAKPTKSKKNWPQRSDTANSLGAWSVNSSGTWASDASEGWASEGWGWNDGSWGSSWDDSWSWSDQRGYWGSGRANWSWKDWGNDDHEPKPAADADDEFEATRVKSILQRGHTVDQLSLDELKSIVKHVDAKQQKKAAEEASPKPAEAASKESGLKNDDESKLQEVAKEENGQECEEKVETKEQRRKRLHARNMRFYRSFESPNCPKEIKKLAKKASGDSSKRSFLFENWLTSQECWMKSSLLQRLRSKNSNAKRGLRRWLTKAEMQDRWGAEITKAMIETKETDDEKALTEIRPHPELPNREDECI
ncbi:unnamed protein product [Symbiodinium sp. KB8]|nr:unnamed protein product [Symbiodinium sp. KB8]